MKVSAAGRSTGVVALLVAAMTAPGAGASAAQIRSDDFPAAALAAAHLGALVLSAWVLLVLLTAMARIQLPGVPAAVRAVLFTTAIVAVATAPAQADTAHDIDGLTLPDRPMTAQTTSPSVTERERPKAPDAVRVRGGDSLWSIAAGRLRPDASPADVARSVMRWYDANRDVVGPDPDLIHPGQVLTSPTPHHDNPEQDVP